VDTTSSSIPVHTPTPIVVTSTPVAVDTPVIIVVTSTPYQPVIVEERVDNIVATTGLIDVNVPHQVTDVGIKYDNAQGVTVTELHCTHGVISRWCAIPYPTSASNISIAVQDRYGWHYVDVTTDDIADGHVLIVSHSYKGNDVYNVHR
jgi:hypothetical protein